MYGLIHLSTELISINGSYALGSMSEDCLEANNKDTRLFLQYLSRKYEPVKQLTDVMARLLERSNPDVYTQMHNYNAKKHCSECGSAEHTIRSYSNMTSLPKKLFASLIEDIFLD